MTGVPRRMRKGSGPKFESNEGAERLEPIFERLRLKDDRKE
jgi:hypothetical protein